MHQYAFISINVAKLRARENECHIFFSSLSELLSFSGDDEINLAGGVNKFVTDVAVKSDGKCVWSGPATFKVNCEMAISEWPFDRQKCELAFGSFTYGNNLLKLKLFKAKSNFTSKSVLYFLTIELIFMLKLLIVELPFPFFDINVIIIKVTLFISTTVILSLFQLTNVGNIIVITNVIVKLACYDWSNLTNSRVITFII